ncbi:hypothetical protein GALL_409610 [mine drainage metagenome]|uniref:DUF924 domain-containing protein n=1 Tax=mine drainage metagenome TaxID=410659 RepID=A0A1J5Q236_9ZZZZ
MTPRDILRFWFEETDPASWWSARPEFDSLVRERYGAVLPRAARGECFEWRADAPGRLAEIIVLDQFSRNAYRGTAAAFAQDPMALALAQEAVARGCHRELDPTRRGFLLLPFMHSESALIHATAEALYREFGDANSLDFELRHKAIIERFGRYPHRNAILGRASTAAEVEFLKQPGSAF